MKNDYYYFDSHIKIIKYINQNVTFLPPHCGDCFGVDEDF